MNAPLDWINIDQAARATGLSSAVIRMWGIRYGWPAPPRARNGYRLFPPSLIENLRRVKAALDAGSHITGIIVDGELRLPGARVHRELDLSPARYLQRPQRADALAMRWDVLRALEQRNVGELRALVLAGASRLHVEDRGLAVYEPCLVGLTCWAQAGDPLPGAAELRTAILDTEAAHAHPA